MVGEPDFISLASRLTPQHMIWWAARFRQHDKGKARASRAEWYLASINNTLLEYYGCKTPLNDKARIRFEYLTEEERMQRKIKEHKTVMAQLKAMSNYGK